MLFSRRRRPAKDGPEHREQVRFFIWLGSVKHPAARLAFAIPNSAIDSKEKSKFFGAEGVRRGIPDIFVAWPNGHEHGLFIELKAPGGEVRPEQTDWMERLTEAGYACYVCYGCRQAIKAFNEYLGA